MIPKMRPSLLIVLVLAVVGLASLVYGLVVRGRASDEAATPQLSLSSAQPSPLITAFGQWELYKNPSDGYFVYLPTDWREISNSGGTVTFAPRKNAQPLGSMKQVTFILVTQPEKYKRLVTQDEFDQWYAAPSEYASAAGRLQKIDNETVDGQRAVSILDSGSGEQDATDWRIVTWIRRHERNYYIHALGTETFTDQDAAAYHTILANFKFVN